MTQERKPEKTEDTQPSTSSAKPGYSDDPPKRSESRYSSQEDDKEKDYDSSKGERE